MLVIVAEGASITPLPQLPGDQSEQGVEPLPLLHRELSAEMCPPLGDGHAGLWSDVLQAKSAQKNSSITYCLFLDQSAVLECLNLAARDVSQAPSSKRMSRMVSSPHQGECEELCQRLLESR